ATRRSSRPSPTCWSRTSRAAPSRSRRVTSSPTRSTPAWTTGASSPRPPRTRPRSSRRRSRAGSASVRGGHAQDLLGGGQAEAHLLEAVLAEPPHALRDGSGGDLVGRGPAQDERA